MKNPFEGKNQSGFNLTDMILWLVIAGLAMAAILFGLPILFPDLAASKAGRSDTSSQPAAPSTPAPAPAVTFDATIPLTILIVGVVGFLAYKFVMPLFLTRRTAAKTLKAAIAQRAADWNALRSRKETLMVEWSKYETDVALMIDYPIMTDYTDPVVSKVIAAMQKIRSAEMMTGDTSNVDAADSALQAAVDEFELAFHTAEKYARRYGQTKLDAREQRKLETARTALNIILDGEAPAYEVEAAYKSLRSSLKGIIDLPQQAVAALESAVRKELVRA